MTDPARAHMLDTPPSRVRFFFGHQSVGDNLIAGLHELASQPGTVPAIEELHAPNSEDRAPPVLLHARLGQNMDPRSKLDAFAQWLDAGLARSIDYAMLKFCYVDIADADAAKKIYDAYTDCMSRIQRSHPKLRLVHCTVPLRVLPRGPYAWLRKTLGDRHPEFARNRAREWFNDRLRTDFGAAPQLFDLALAESTLTDGRRCVQRLAGEDIASLVPGYTFDGGHLNGQGRRIAAAAFLHLFNALESP